MKISNFKTLILVAVGGVVLIGGAWYFGTQAGKPSVAEAAALMAKLSDRMNHLQSFRLDATHDWSGEPSSPLLLTALKSGSRTADVHTKLNAVLDTAGGDAKIAATAGFKIVSGGTETTNAEIEFRTLTDKSYLNIKSLKLPSILASYETGSFLNHWMAFTKRQPPPIPSALTTENPVTSALREFFSHANAFELKKILRDETEDGVTVHRFQLAFNAEALKKLALTAESAINNPAVPKPSEGELDAALKKHLNDTIEIHVDDAGYPHRLLVSGEGRTKYALDLHLSDFETSMLIEAPVGAADADELINMMKPKK